MLAVLKAVLVEIVAMPDAQMRCQMFRHLRLLFECLHRGPAQAVSLFTEEAFDKADIAPELIDIILRELLPALRIDVICLDLSAALSKFLNEANSYDCPSRHGPWESPEAELKDIESKISTRRCRLEEVRRTQTALTELTLTALSDAVARQQDASTASHVFLWVALVLPCIPIFCFVFR